MNKISILVVDDHAFFRGGVVAWLRTQADVHCCGEAGSIHAARQAAAALQPEVILLDLNLGDGDGLDLLRDFPADGIKSRTIVLSQNSEEIYAHRALRAGARGYVMKSEASEVVLDAIRTVMAGEIYLSRNTKAKLLHNLFPDPAAKPPFLSSLSDRELQVFQLLGAGCSPREIGDRLKISPKTVDTYREHLKDKLELRNGAALLKAATLWVEKGIADFGKISLLP